jgi:hypothetical protein
MSVWKKLNKQDAFVTTYVAKKRWTLSGDDLESAGVKLLPAYASFSTNIESFVEAPQYLFQVQGVSLGDTCLVAVEGVSLDICEIILSGSVVTT